MDWKTYFTKWSQAILQNFLSVKVWMFILPMTIFTAILLYLANEDYTTMISQITKSNLTGEQVVTLITSQRDYFVKLIQFYFTSVGAIIGSVIAVREVFKVSKLNSLSNSEVKEMRE